MENKRNQLGMNPSTANGRLLKDLLFNFVIRENHVCYRCDGQLKRENFSIEHKIPWLDSEDPITLYFSLDNIAYSHLLCNIGARRTTQRPRAYTHGTSGYRVGCRCDICRGAYSVARSNKYKLRNN